MRSIYKLLLTGAFLMASTFSYTQNTKQMNTKELEVITLGAGCFWCVEAVFQDLIGVEKVESGYANGAGGKPTYKEVCTGQTGYAEVAQITFDPKIISLEQLLEVFWHTHNPTTLNRQGADRGTQYRSGIYYTDEAQKKIAEQSKEKIEESALWEEAIVTEIVPLENYYPAEDYHQNYYKQNSQQGYCQIVIAPKLKKLYKEYKHLLKSQH